MLQGSICVQSDPTLQGSICVHHLVSINHAQFSIREYDVLSKLRIRFQQR